MTFEDLPTDHAAARSWIDRQRAALAHTVLYYVGSLGCI